MNRDCVFREINLFLVPFYCERISLRFWLVWILRMLLISLMPYLALQVYLMLFWGLGYLLFGFVLAWREGVFDT